MRKMLWIVRLYVSALYSSARMRIHFIFTRTSTERKAYFSNGFLNHKQNDFSLGEILLDKRLRFFLNGIYRIDTIENWSKH